MATKKKSDIIKLESQGKTQDGKSTGTFYTTKKNKVNNPEKFEFRKFDPRAFNAATGKNGMHVLFKETKLK